MKNPRVLGWATASLAIAGWAGICCLYPIYFQRDDVFWLLDWPMNHTWLDAFVRNTGDPYWNGEGRFLPVLALIRLLEQRLFGLHEWPYQFLLGVAFIFSLFFLFLIVKNARNAAAAALAVALWPVAFNGQMTTLFWFTDNIHIAEMLFLCSGLYVFTRSFGASRPGVALAILLMAFAMLTRDPARIILPTTLAAFMFFEGHFSLRWSWLRTILTTSIPLLLGVIYVLFFHNYGMSSGEQDPGFGPFLAAMLVRLGFYGKLLSGGITGLALVLPAAHVALKRVFPTRMALSLAAILALTVALMHWHYVGLLLLLVGGLCLPVRVWFFLPWVFVPLAGLLLIHNVIPTYMFELTFGAAALAGMQWAIVVEDLRSDSCLLRIPRTVALSGMVLLLLAGLGAGSVKISRLAKLLRLRSDMTMLLKQATPALRNLPEGSTLAIVNYEDMGIRFIEDMIHWSEEEKILTQSPLVPKKWATSWLRVIGRPDVAIADWGSQPQDAYLLLFTAKERAFFAKQNLPSETMAQASRGQASMVLLRLISPP